MSDALKEFEGRTKVISQLNFGFIEDIFIVPKIIKESNLNYVQQVKESAILSFKKKKIEWGWKEIEIKQVKTNTTLIKNFTK
jgi:hypothetical protein